VNGDPVNFGDPSGTNAISAPIVPGDCDGDPGFFGCGDDFQSWGGPCGSVYVMTYVNGMQIPTPCDLAPVFFVPQKPAQPAAPYLAGLELVGDCYDRSADAVGQAFGAAVDDLTFQPITQYGTAYQGPLTITEKNTIIRGNSTSINATWVVSGGGTFTDSISSGAQKVFQETESYFVNGSSTPVNLNWFYGGVYAVMGIYATPNAVIINNTVPVNKNGSAHYCDQPDSIQNR
jgi:hypothetical protein